MTTRNDNDLGSSISSIPEIQEANVVIPRWLKNLQRRLLQLKTAGIYTIVLIVREDGSRKVIVNGPSPKVEHLGAD